GLVALPRRGPRRRTLRPQPRSSAEKRLRIVVVRGVGIRRAGVGGEHRRAGRRISPLPPTMGMVDDAGAGAAGIHRKQSGVGVAAVVRPRTGTGSRFWNQWVM